MWAIVTGVPAGKLASWAANPTVAAPVTAPTALGGTSSVMVATPRAFASALAIGGTSLAALMVAVRTIAPALDGVVGVLLSLPHAATNRNAVPTSASRVIVCLSAGLYVSPPVPIQQDTANSATSAHRARRR